jgi:hypothetical protein
LQVGALNFWGTKICPKNESNICLASECDNILMCTMSRCNFNQLGDDVIKWQNKCSVLKLNTTLKLKQNPGDVTGLDLDHVEAEK